MFLSLTSTAPAASDLGYLLHKHPDRHQVFDLPVGRAHVFYPEASDTRCTVALVLEIDPVDIVRSRRFGEHGPLAAYVNDRTYAAGSLLAVALGRVFGSAMRGGCAGHEDLAATPLPLTIHLPALQCDGDPGRVRALFEPLGWSVAAAQIPLDPTQPAWGDARLVDLTLTGTARLADALTQLYLLMPVLDGEKHYWVDASEADKLLRRGGAWLANHPEREWITRRYLAHRRDYVADALTRLAALDDSTEVAPPPPGEGSEPAQPLRRQRMDAVLAALHDVGAHRVVDLGCGEGALLRELLADNTFHEIVGADVSARALAGAERRLRLDQLPDRTRERLTLLQTSATYRDTRLTAYDAIVLMEVVEHIDPPRLAALEIAVFGQARPGAVIVTTSNREYNSRYAGLPPGAMRHPDHRFEWTRAEFRSWALPLAERHGYAVEFRPVGADDPQLGSPTQLALFRREAP
ncbi:3' terminal RNA ribose 2'-O-methyltransferase Hen1 [Nostocoides vanveenii]|uniref:Small RNA 2'-O-methyltransferase n=1 Tax=Nostocoides vanveenii TaxID=330835 RepID=A0ABN2JYV5_9MICO